jgi:sec-independent protein translocase protein TatA
MPPDTPLDGGGTVLGMIAFSAGPELIVVAVVVLVLFGGSQIPKLARNLGQAQKEFKKGISEGSADAEETPTTKAE